MEVPWGHIAGRWYGNRKVRPILALHGWQDNLGTWDRLLPLLPQHIGVLCVDLPGHGRSSKYPKGMVYHVIDYVHIILRIVKEYKWRKVSLLGHSMGAVLCFIYTTLYPHTVDMLMQIDIIKPLARTNDFSIKRFALYTEKLLIETDRLNELHHTEPPAYTYQELEDIMYRGSNNSLEQESCKYLLNRSIAPSQMYPEKFYFSRDPRIKYHQQFTGEHGIALEMAKRIRNKNILIIKSTKSQYITDDSADIIGVLRQNNRNFEWYEIEGTHHVHLNNPHEVAKAIVPFILRHRPVPLDTWSLDNDQEELNNRNSKL